MAKTLGPGRGKKKLGKGKRRIKIKIRGNSTAAKLRHRQYKKQGRE